LYLRSQTFAKEWWSRDLLHFSEHKIRSIVTLVADCIRSVAKATAPGVSITAQTFPEDNASARILRKLGFVLKGSVMDREEGTVWEWSDEKAKM
jgi:hypothetical protein